MIWVLRGSLLVLVSEPNKPHDNGLVGDMDMADWLQDGLSWGDEVGSRTVAQAPPCWGGRGAHPQLPPLIPAKN